MTPSARLIATAPAAETDRVWYESRRRDHIQETRGRLPAHLERMSWPADRLRAERETRLRELIRVATARSSWHRERLGHLNPADVSESNLAQLPVMTKHDLMTNFDRIVTDSRLTLDLIENHLDTITSDAYLLDRFHAVASGGSSGRRGVFVYDWESWADCYLSCLRYVIRARLQSPQPAAGPTVIAAVAAEHATHMSSALPQTFTDPESMVVARVPITLPLPQIVGRLNGANPDVLISYPSILPELAHAAWEGQLNIRPRAIISVSEPLLPEIRSVTEETWGAPVMNWWASSEAGGMGISCGRGPGMHLNDDLVIVEPVDADGNPVPAGVRSAKIYLTNLYNPLLPLIRYEVTDEIVLIPDAEPCSCGSAHRRLEDVHGRLDDLFFYDGIGAVHPHIFRSRLGRDRAIVEYQVHQTERGAAIALRCREAVDIPRLRQDLSNDLIRLGLMAPEITIETVDHLERQSTGKLKRFLPLATASGMALAAGHRA